MFLPICLAVVLAIYTMNHWPRMLCSGICCAEGFGDLRKTVKKQKIQKNKTFKDDSFSMIRG